ncbi:MAG: PKD domain-containing protein, partial [Flavobacteriales bacterium]|nr:PKD domain-containing protein [Flavobacteriales bacterium]
MWKPLFATLAILAMASVHAQGSFLISQPVISTCQASLQDTGGEPGGGYQNNESFITTICPNSPGLAVSLNFGATPFNLSTAGTEPIDQLRIWDGPDDTYPLIGTWTGNNSPGIISASFQNAQTTGGCLAVRFTSNETGTGRFAAFISCAIPCEPPTASAIMVGAPTQPVRACQNTPITFDGSASTAAQGQGISEYKWDFGDGVVDSLSGAIVTHSYATSGEH